MQEIHQYHNPAQVVKECRTVDQHYHPDSDAHHCDLCDFKITCFPAFAAIAIHTNNIIDNWFANDQQVILKDLLSYSSRGPPMS